MTSKSLFFKLMKEDMKRRLWAVAFSLLTFFFAMPMAAAMGIASIGKEYENWLVNGTGYAEIGADALKHTKILRLVGEVLGFENAFLCVLVAAAAMILGLTGFLYLHSKKQVDFYNCLPVKREQLFAVKFLDGFLILFAAYLINMIAAFAIFCGNGIQGGSIVKMMLSAFATHMVGFLLIYAVMVIAVLLTGNLFISILGAGVLYGYAPAISLLLSVLKEFFFVTTGRNSDMGWIAEYGSPIGYYAKLMEAGLRIFHSDQFFDDIDYGYSRIQMSIGSTGTGRGLYKLCVIGLLAAVLLTVLALILYKLRPSESAGKAMAFKKTQAPIKVLLLVPVTTAATILLWSIYYSLSWAAIGFILGLVLMSCMIEIIYHFDFSKLFSNPAQTAAGGVLALLLIGIFWTDAIGYDSYLPNEKNFNYASINAHLDDLDYGLPYRNGTSYGWKYLDYGNYADENMKLTDYAKVLTFAEHGVEEAKLQREAKIKGNSTSIYDDSERMIYAQVGFHMKNGKTVYRSYTIPRSVLGSSLDELYASREYKEGTYPVMSYTPENITGIYWMTDGDISELRTDDSMKAEILSAYQDELAGLTLNERAVNAPVAALRFLTTAEQEYLTVISKQRGNTSSGFRLDDMNNVNFFPVYPSFTKTIALLKQAGLDVEQRISVDEVAAVKILYPVDYETEQTGTDPQTGESVLTADMVADESAVQAEVSSDEGMAIATRTYDDNYRAITIVNDGSEENRKKIGEVLSASASDNLLQRNRLCTYESGIEIYVELKPSGNEVLTGTPEERLYRFVGTTIPEFLDQTLNYDQIVNKSVNQGIGVSESD